MIDFKFDLQLFGGVASAVGGVVGGLVGGGGGGGGGSSSSSSSSYTPSAEEQQLMGYIAKNGETAQGGIQSMLNQFNSGVSSDSFKNLLGQSSGMIQSGQNMYSDLMNGKLPSAYTDNMQEAIRSGVKNTVGSTVNGLSGRGVLNSSVTNKALNDVEGNVANAMAQNYNQNVSQLAGLAGKQIGSATAGYTPYSTLAQLAQSQQHSFLTSPVGALHGTGVTSSSSNSNDGSGSPLLNAALGLGTGWVGKQMGLSSLFK